MYAYKGFEPDLSCRGYRFVMGKNVTPEANCASNGFHCAEDPLDCLSYYRQHHCSAHDCGTAGIVLGNLYCCIKGVM